MRKWCFNYESGEYEEIDRDGFSISQGRHVFNWDDSEFRRVEKEEEFNRWRFHHSIWGDEDN